MSLQPVDAVFVNTLSSMAATPEPPVVKAATPEPEHNRVVCMFFINSSLSFQVFYFEV